MRNKDTYNISVRKLNRISLALSKKNNDPRNCYDFAVMMAYLESLDLQQSLLFNTDATGFGFLVSEDTEMFFMLLVVLYHHE